MWKIDDAVALDRENADAALRRIQSDLSEMAHTAVKASPSRVDYAISKMRWWMGGRPFDLTEGGFICIDHATRQLAIRITMRRTFFGCLAMSVVLAVFAVIVFEASATRAALYGLVGFAWLWGVNYYRTRNSILGYLKKVALTA